MIIVYLKAVTVSAISIFKFFKLFCWGSDVKIVN